MLLMTGLYFNNKEIPVYEEPRGTTLLKIMEFQSRNSIMNAVSSEFT